MSASISPSASPSAGYEDYSRGGYAILPLDNTDLETPYSEQDYIDVSTKNDVRVSQNASGEYAIHQFKDFASTTTTCTIEWEGQTNIAPSSSTVYLQIFNYNTSLWETIDSDNTSSVNTDFTLTANVLDLTDYKNANNITSCRVYQLAI